MESDMRGVLDVHPAPPRRSVASFGLRTFGMPGGFGYRVWSRLLRENQYAIDPAYGLKAAQTTLFSVTNALAGALERQRFGRQVAEARVYPPLFVLGHWRSGTTYLHRLLACDERFAYPNTFQCLHPLSFLLDEAVLGALFQRFSPAVRPHDNVALSMDSPQEDEFGVMYLSGLSWNTGLVFPRGRQRYDRFLTLRTLTLQERARWKATLLWFLKKLTWKYQRPLLLKSPAHTGRIRTLLDLFPDARFVHIHRNPYEVFPSTVRSMAISRSIFGVQELGLPDDTEHVLQTYTDLHEAFFEDLPRIPDGHFHQIAFEDLERDPRGTIAEVYAALNLPGFREMEPRLLEYVASLGQYQKNPIVPLGAEQRRQIAACWRRCFEAWGYAR